jgi:hypothetical protein
MLPAGAVATALLTSTNEPLAALMSDAGQTDFAINKIVAAKIGAVLNLDIIISVLLKKLGNL